MEKIYKVEFMKYTNVSKDTVSNQTKETVSNQIKEIKDKNPK